MRLDLDLTRGQLLVFGPRRAPLDGAPHPDHRLRSKLTTDRMSLRVDGVAGMDAPALCIEDGK